MSGGLVKTSDESSVTWLQATPPGAFCALFVLAHPDDEAFCLPLITAELRGGRTVHVVYLTDGGPTAAIREAESLRVLGRIGVSPERVRFAGREQGWPDGGLFRHVDAAKAWLARELTAMGPCARIYVTAYEGGHHDHDCSYGIVCALLRDGLLAETTCLQFPLYTGRGLSGALFRCMSPIPENGAHLVYPLGAREALSAWSTTTAYPSQWKTWIALGPASAWAFLARRSIVLQRVDPARVTQAPHQGVPYYERRFKIPLQTVLEAVKPRS